ncbi:TPA: branched-chain amino acid ABC transporter permease [Candidatus Bipolaricaulota bacterium]|nr:branched-chain amino acid ABC transporter permease [Candidatus Bipolaricaulota bacterium]
MAEIVLFSLAISALYSLVAIGFTMIFGVGGVLNLAHGALLMASAYAAFGAKVHLGLNLYLSAALAVIFTTLLALAMYKGLVRYVQGSRIITMIVTLALALALEELVRLGFGSTPGILRPLIWGNVLLFGVKLGRTQILGVAISWMAIGLLWFFVRWTRLGKAILATAQDRIGAALMGIDPERVYSLTWAISGALAGVAGVFFASQLAMLPTMWRDPLVIAFAIVILGGLGNIQGSLLAAYIVGFLETLTVYLLSPAWRGLPSLILLILILILRPGGLFGRELR